MIRIILPYHLRTLARIEGDLQLEVAPPITQRSILDAIEARFPMLQGTIRDHGSEKRRPMIRFFACNEDMSHESPDKPLPEAVASGKEAFWIVGAIAGGGESQDQSESPSHVQTSGGIYSSRGKPGGSWAD